MDFVPDTLLDGRRIRALTVIDNFTRGYKIKEMDFTLTGTKVVPALEWVGNQTGYPDMITVDHGSDFTSQALDAPTYAQEVRWSTEELSEYFEQE